MAYRSSGTDNGGMVSNLKRFGVISSLSVEEGFRLVDRKFFVPKGTIRMAHSDQPIKEGNIHISAPHIYGTILEALDLPRNKPLSFLNVGSGTGYLTCIAASIMGPKSMHHCIELHEDAIDHCHNAIEMWKRETPSAQRIHQIEVIHGNAFDLNTEVGECVFGFDRIYIGASIGISELPFFKMLLKPGGILVGPVDSELVKVVRHHSSMMKDDFIQEVLSPVRFAPLVSNAYIPTVVPSRVWNPSMHNLYPEPFQQSCKTLLLCSRAERVQPNFQDRCSTEEQNLASMLPNTLWMEILTFTHRDWFVAPPSEVDTLRRQLQEEKDKAERANRARLEADARCHLIEKERDIYRLLALRSSSISDTFQPVNDDTSLEVLERAATAVLLGGGTLEAGLRNVFRRYRSQVVDFYGSSSDGESDAESELSTDHSDQMDEDDEEESSLDAEPVPESPLRSSGGEKLRTLDSAREGRQTQVVY